MGGAPFWTPGLLAPGDPGLYIRARMETGRVAVLTLQGSVDRSCGPILENRVAEAVADGALHLLVDCVQVEVKDAGALRPALGLAEGLRARGGSLRLARLSAPSAKAVSDAGLEFDLDVHGDLADAQAAIQALCEARR